MMNTHSILSLMFSLASMGCMGGYGGGGFSGASGMVDPTAPAGTLGGPSEDERARAWNLHYTAPEGWTTRSMGAITVHGSQDTSRAVFVGRSLFTTYDQALRAAAVFGQSLGLTTTGVVEAPTESTVAGLRATAGTYTGYNAAGLPTQGRLLVLFTEHGTSLTLFGISAPEAAPEVAQVMDRLASSVRAGAPMIDAEAVRALAGRWVYSDTNYRRSETSRSSRGVEATLTCDGAGGFHFGSNSWVSVDVSRRPVGESPVDLGGADSSRSFSEQGRYTVIGREVVFVGTQGQLVVPFSLQGSALTLGTTVYGRS